MILEGKESGLESDSSDITVVHATDSLRAVAFRTELGKQGHQLPRETGREVDVVNLIDRDGAVLHNPSDVLLGWLHIVNCRHSLYGLAFVINL